MSGPRGWCACLLAAVVITAVLIAFPPAASALETTAVSSGELLKIQAQVQSRLDAASRALVAVEAGDGAASGVIISPDGLVMTAAHVTSEPGRKVKLRLHDGSEVSCQALGLDRATDAAMMRIDGKRQDWPHVPLCRDLRLAQPGAWCFALGHPGGRDEKRGPVLRVGRVLKQTPNGLQTDCVLMGGDSGGPLFNLDGEVIGIHSQIWQARDQNIHVSVAPFLRAWDDLKKSAIVRAWSTGAGGWLGVLTRLTGKQELEVEDVAKDSPAARAGLKAGDVILALDGERILDKLQFSAAIKRRLAGEQVSLHVKSGSGNRTLDVKLATEPKEELR